MKDETIRYALSTGVVPRRAFDRIGQIGIEET